MELFKMIIMYLAMCQIIKYCSELWVQCFDYITHACFIFYVSWSWNWLAMPRVQTNTNISAEHRTKPKIQVPLIPNRTGFPIFRVQLMEPETIPWEFGFNRTVNEPCPNSFLEQNFSCVVKNMKHISWYLDFCPFSN